MFSATLPKLLVEFAKAGQSHDMYYYYYSVRYSVRPPLGLKDPVLIRLDVDNQLNDQLRTDYFHCRQDDKPGQYNHTHYCIYK